MFRPNVTGVLEHVIGRDIHNRETYGDPIDCPFAHVDLTLEALRTTVRADSSASRGSADETISKTKILIIPDIVPKIGDRFSFGDISYKIQAVHPRRSVFGSLDHYECDLEVVPA